MSGKNLIRVHSYSFPSTSLMYVDIMLDRERPSYKAGYFVFLNAAPGKPAPGSASGRTFALDEHMTMKISSFKLASLAYAGLRYTTLTAVSSQSFYAYGEIMLHQKQTWDGPVYSEGNNHWYYCGLTDGNYAQDQRYNLRDKPWLVDFDLLKMHDLCCNFGVGNISMFYGRKADLGRSSEEIRDTLDRFLAATLAFGHPGFLLRAGGVESSMRSYYMLQQIQDLGMETDHPPICAVDAHAADPHRRA